MFIQLVIGETVCFIVWCFKEFHISVLRKEGTVDEEEGVSSYWIILIYQTLKEDALNCTVWRSRCGSVVVWTT